MQKAELLNRYAKTNDDALFLAQLLDKSTLCARKNIPVSGDFLDPHKQALTQALSAHLPVFPTLWGGYPDAERKMIFFLPDYMEAPPEDAISLLVLTHRDARSPHHRDYLGSLLGLGVKREGVGDILVEPQKAQVLIRASLSDFFLSQYTKAGRVQLSVSVLPLSALSIVNAEPVFKTASLASLRADAVLSAAFSVSRSMALEAIEAQRVYLNNLPLTKADKLLEARDKIRWQGKGRFVLEEIGGTSRKGRTFVTFRF